MLPYDFIVVICCIVLYTIFKHFFKSKNYIDDTYNYAFASTTVFTKKPNDLLIMDKVSNASTASTPPMYPVIYRNIILKYNISPLKIQTFFELILYLVLFLLVYQLQNISMGILAVVVTMASPLVFGETLYYTDRLLAITLLWCNFTGVYLWLSTGVNLYIVYIILTYILLVFTHKHSYQLLLIVYLIISVFYLKFDLLIYVLIAEIIGGILSRGYLWEIHKNHCLLLDFCRLFLFPSNSKGGYGKEQLFLLRRNLNTAVSNNAFRRSISSIVFHWDYFLHIPLSIFFLLNIYNCDFFTIIYLTTILVAIIIQFVYYFKFLGEGNRYLEYANFPLIMLIANYLDNHYILFFIFLWTIGAIFININKLMKIRKNVHILSDWSLMSAINYIKNQSWDRFIVFPISKTYIFAWYSQKSILHFFGAKGFWQAKDWFPQIRRPIPTFYDEYDINYIFLDERYVTTKEVDFGAIEEVYRQNSYVVYRILREQVKSE